MWERASSRRENRARAHTPRPILIRIRAPSRSFALLRGEKIFPLTPPAQTPRSHFARGDSSKNLTRRTQDLAPESPAWPASRSHRWRIQPLDKVVVRFFVRRGRQVKSPVRKALPDHLARHGQHPTRRAVSSQRNQFLRIPLAQHERHAVVREMRTHPVRTRQTEPWFKTHAWLHPANPPCIDVHRINPTHHIQVVADFGRAPDRNARRHLTFPRHLPRSAVEGVELLRLPRAQPQRATFRINGLRLGERRGPTL